MPTEPPPPARSETGNPGDAGPQRTEQTSAPADASGDVDPGERPSDRRAAAPWVQSADASGTVRSQREMPEPDSPGG